jgi:hypothetical protein
LRKDTSDAYADENDHNDWDHYPKNTQEESLDQRKRKRVPMQDIAENLTKEKNKRNKWNLVDFLGDVTTDIYFY